MTVLKDYVRSVLDRQSVYIKAEEYYEGDVAERFASARNARLFGTDYDSKLNFCRPVVDAVLDRLELKNLKGTTQEATKMVNRVAEHNQLDLEAPEIHRRTLEYGDTFAIVWPNGDGEWDITLNSPRGMALVYDPENPRKKLYAVKMWRVSDSETRMNVFFADRIEKYITPKGDPSEASDWTLIDTVDNEFGEVPVFHFRTSRPFGRPEHADFYDAQDYINKEFVQSMITIDYQGAPQRYALAKAGASSEVDDFNEGDTDRENVNALKNGPGELWYLANVEKVGEFQPADPKVFWEPIKNTIRAGASLTNTPLHYFERTGNVPSGEALRTAEAPLLKKVRARAASFGQTWKEIFAFILKAENINAKVEITWGEMESQDEGARWDVAIKKRNAGVSIAQTLREAGYDEDEIPGILEEARAEREAGLSATYERATRVSTEDSETFEAKDGNTE